MDDKWGASSGIAARRRRMRIAGGAALLAVVVAIWVFPKSNEEAVDVGSTPGFDGSGRSIDTTPFDPNGRELALPEDLERLLSTTTTQPPTTSTTTTTTTAPPTTTIPPPTAPEVPSAGAIEDLCGMTRSLVSLQYLRGLEPSEVLESVNALGRNLDRYEQVAPEVLKPTVAIIGARIQVIIDAAEEADGDLDDPKMVALMDDAASGRGQFEEMVNSIALVARWETEEC